MSTRDREKSIGSFFLLAVLLAAFSFSTQAQPRTQWEYRGVNYPTRALAEQAMRGEAGFELMEEVNRSLSGETLTIFYADLGVPAEEHPHSGYFVSTPHCYPGPPPHPNWTDGTLDSPGAAAEFCIDYFLDFGPGQCEASYIPPGGPYEYIGSAGAIDLDGDLIPDAVHHIERNPPAASGARWVFEFHLLGTNGVCNSEPTFVDETFMNHHVFLVCPEDRPRHGRFENRFSNYCTNNNQAQIRKRVTQFCTEERGNPCSPVTGNKTAYETDFEHETLRFERTYNSAQELPAATGFATGWTHNYSDRLLGTSQRHLITAEGHLEEFESASGSLWASKNRLGHTMERSGSGASLRFAWTRPGGERRIFDRAGRLIEIHPEDSPDQPTRLFYQGDLLTQVVDPSGRSLDFHYAQNRIDHITLPDGGALHFQHDVHGNLAAITYADGASRLYHYEDADLPHHLTGITDENGHRYATYVYDSMGRAVRSEHAGGADLYTFDYIDDQQTVVTTPLGAQITYDFNDTLFLKTTGVSDGRGTLSSTYSGNRVTQRTDRNGHVTAYFYDALHEIRRIEASGTDEERTIETDWDDGLNRITEIREPGRTTRFTYDAVGRLLTRSLLDPATGTSRTWSYVYHSGGVLDGLMASVDGPRAGAIDVTTYDYYDTDLPGHHRARDLRKITNAAGHSLDFLRYDDAGRVIEMTDLGGTAATLTYSPRGRLTSVTADGEMVSLVYDGVGQITRLVLTDGSSFDYAYDAARRLVSVTDATGDVLDYTLDAAGQRIAESRLAAGQVVKQTMSRLFDDFGRLERRVDASGAALDFAHDANGNRIGRSGPLPGRASDFVFDAFDRLIRRDDAIGTLARTSHYAYDGRDNVVSVTDPLGHVTTYTYDSFDHVVQVDSPDAGSTSYAYDGAGNIIRQTDARGVVTDFAYDGLNRLTATSYPSEPAFDIAYRYDEGLHGAGNLTSMTDASGSTSWSYDALGRVVGKTQTPTGGTATPLHLSYTYAGTGRLSSIAYPSGGTLSLEHDDAGRTTRLTWSHGGQSEELIAGVSYLPFGPASQIDYSGVSQDQGRLYDMEYEPLGFTGGLERAYGTNEAGEITGITVGGDHWGYAYDDLGRLTGVEDPYGNTSESWSYDLNGNLLSNIDQFFTIDASSNRLVRGFQLFHQYDETGNTTSTLQGLIGGREMFYGPNGRLLRARRDGNFRLGQYIHNGRGERVGKVLKARDRRGGPYAGMTYFLYDETGQLLGEYDQRGEVIKEFLWLDRLLVGIWAEGTLHRVYSDHLGAPRQVAKADGTVVWRWESLKDAYGDSLPDEDPDRDGKDFVLNLRFPGQYFDIETGFFYNYFRDYDPEKGRYIESDPIGLRGGLNPYVYGANNPLSQVDRFGLINDNGRFTGLPPEFADKARQRYCIGNEKDCQKLFVDCYNSRLSFRDHGTVVSVIVLGGGVAVARGIIGRAIKRNIASEIGQDFSNGASGALLGGLGGLGGAFFVRGLLDDFLGECEGKLLKCRQRERSRQDR